jgi:glutamyl-Q tRNA(Asp) synthetase
MFVTRFAPSPTGLLHLGHAFSALTAFDAAQKAGGRFVLRIEDTDVTRCKAEFETAIFEDLAWLGITWDEPVRRQSDHMAEYAAVLARLIGLGVMYRCFKTRKDLMADIASAPHGPILAYRGEPLAPAVEAERLASGEAFAWRLSLDLSLQVLNNRQQPNSSPLAFRRDGLGCEIDGVWTPIDPTRTGDAVIARKEFAASYHLASVWDDALQGITHVIRGADLNEAPHLHVLLQALLDLPTPSYTHHRMILDEDGKRLAKRDHSITLRAMRDARVTAGDIRAQLGLAL